MNCQKICFGISKYALRELRLSRRMIDNNRLISKKMFTASSTILVSRSNNSDYHREKTPCHFMLSAGVLFTLFDFWKKEEEEIPELIMTLKRSVLLMQRGEYVKAEQMLHIALNQAQILQNYDGITYVYDLLANVAFDTENYKKAEKLFVSVLQRLVSSGTPQNDLKVIHISLKLARIFERTNDIQKAEQGYTFCIDELRNQMAENDDENAVALLGMTLDWYAHMLFSQLKYAEALKYLSEAYAICVKLNGEVHEQSVVLLNDLGTMYYMVGQHDLAFEHLSKAAKIGASLTELVEFGSIHVNLGNVLLEKGMIQEAQKACEKGKRIAKARQDEDTTVEAEKCLNRIKKYLLSIKQ